MSSATVASASSNSTTSVEVSSVASASTHVTSTSLINNRLMMVGSDTSFQIQSWERNDLCMEVFKTLDTVGRIWLRQCKSNSQRGIERQMFGVSDDGKLHPSTITSSCIFLYSNKEVKYRINCAGVLHKDKTQFMYDFFDHTFFLMGDVTKILTVSKLKEKKEVKLQKRVSSNNSIQRWNLRFERDRVLGNCKSAVVVPWTRPMPSVPTNPPTRWYQVSVWVGKSYFQRVFQLKNIEKKIAIKYG